MQSRKTWFIGGALVAAAIGIAAAGTALATTPTPTPAAAAAPAGKLNVYSAPFTCGLVPAAGVPLDPTQPQQGLPNEMPLKPANYATDINVHNPSTAEVPLVKKAVLTGWVGSGPAGTTGTSTSEPEQIFRGGAFRALVLPPDGAFEVDCNDIKNVLQPPQVPSSATFIKGFVVIETRATLDVQDVITSERVGTTVVQCLLNDGEVVNAAPNAAGVLACPVASPTTGVTTIGIASSNTGTGLSTEIVTISPDVVVVTPANNPTGGGQEAAPRRPAR